MENPWHELNGKLPHVLESDRMFVDQHNENANREHRIVVESIPEPFIGDPNSAKVVLLLLNPGHEDTDPCDHARSEVAKTMFKNLRHERQHFPFYPLGPSFKGTASARWWRRRLSGLIKEVGEEEILAEKLLAIEWFPYHSKYWKSPKCLWPSQQYTFHLAKTMLAKGATVIGMRSRKIWGDVDERLLRIPYLKNPRNVCVSRGNMEAGPWEALVAALKEE